MKDYAELLNAGLVILLFYIYFQYYNTYCICRNHNKVMEVQIKENRQADFYDAEKVKNGIMDRMFISAFLHILSVVICYSLIEKRIGDNLFFSSGLAFSVVILLTGTIVKKHVSTKTWNSEYKYIISEDAGMSKQEKFLLIMSTQEQKNVFIVAAIACALISLPLCSLKVSGMFFAVLVGGVVWFETDIKKMALEIFKILISFIKNWNRLLIFLVPFAIAIMMSWMAKGYTEDGYSTIFIFAVVITNIFWGPIICCEKNRKHRLDRTWRKIQEQKNSSQNEKT